jgi:hypothetical protein
MAFRIRLLLYFGLIILVALAAVGYFASEQVVGYLDLLKNATPEKTRGYYTDLVQMVGIDIFILAISGLVAVITYEKKHFPKWMDAAGKKAATNPTGFISVVVLVFIVISTITATVTLRQFPNSADEFVYLFQAEDLSKGKLWSDVHPLPEFFEFHHLVQKDGKWVGRFPPGYPLLQSLSFFLRIPPFWINMVLGVVLLLVFHRFARRHYDESIAAFSVSILAFSGFYIYNAASFFSHVTSALFSLAFVALIYRYIDERRIWLGVFGGFMVGMLAITRYYTAVLVFIPFLLYVLVKLKGQSWRLLATFAIGGVPPMIILFAYNHAVTGDVLIPPTQWGFTDEALGFVKGHTPASAIKHMIKRLVLFIYWCSPHLLILYFVLLLKKALNRSEQFIHPEDYLFVFLLIGYLFYYHSGGNQYGPRFYFEAFPFLVLFVTAKVVRSRNMWYVVILVSGIVFQILKLPVIAIHESSVIEERTDIYNLVQKNGVKNAIIFISSSVSVKRPMPEEDLNRNDHTYSNDVIYARDLGVKNKMLADYYPRREYYIYKREPDHPRGTLQRINF